MMLNNRLPRVGFSFAFLLVAAGCSGNASLPTTAPVDNSGSGTTSSVVTNAPGIDTSFGSSFVAPGPVSTATPGPAISLPGEMPSRAEDFVESFGLDSKFGSPSNDSANVAKFAPMLSALGVKYLRDGYDTSGTRFATLSALGIKHSISFQASSMTPDVITKAIMSQGPQNIGFVETDNEPDNLGNPNWVPNAVAGQKMLYDTIHANPAFSNIKVLAPALKLISNSTVLGPVAADAGNIHNGTCNFNPGTGVRGAYTLPYLQLEQTVAVNQPVWTTETGYDNDPRSSCYISEDAAAKYIPRTIAYRWNLGMPHSFFNTWTDHPEQAYFAHLGFVTEAGQPKKQYFSTQSLLTTLADKGGSFSPSPLAYTITGQTQNVAHTLLEKSNGGYFLLIWLEEPSWVYRSYNQTGTINNPSQLVTINFTNKRVGGVRLMTYQPDYSLKIANTPASALLGSSRTMAKLRISDSISILRFSAF